MAELKYFNFNISYANYDKPPKMLVDGQDFIFDHEVEKEFLGWIPLHRYGIQPGYDDPQPPDGRFTSQQQCVAWNVKPLFYSDNILPVTEGTTSSTVVGDKYRWRSTMIDLTLNPQRYQELFKSPALNVMISGFNPHKPIAIVGASTPSAQEVRAATFAKGSNSNLNRASSTGLFVDTTLIGSQSVVFPANGLTGAEALDPAGNNIPMASVTNVPQSSYGIALEETKDADMHVGTPGVIPWTMNPSVPLSYSYFPLFKTPNYRPFFYCRLVVFKLKFSQNDYTMFRANVFYQNLFLNSIWWNRFDASGCPNMSVRTNDFNINTPCGGSFDLKYNKLLQINPFKNYRFRINLYSNKRRGDPIEIRRSTIFTDPEVANDYPYYKNGQYIAYLLPPLDVLNDFDGISSLLISAGSFYDPSTYPAADGYNSNINKSFVYGPYTPFSVPLSYHAVVVPHSPQALIKHNYTFLPLCTTKITGRTAYYD